MAIAFDAIGGPANNTGNSWTASWQHNIGATANCIIVAQAVTTQGGLGIPTVGGVSMTLLAGPFNFINTFGQQWIALYGLMNPPTGNAKAISVTNGSFAGYGTTAASVSYSGVFSMGTGITAQGTGNACSVTVPSRTGDLVVAAMTAVTNTGTTITAFNGTSRVNAASVSPGGYGAFPLLIGQIAGASSVTATGTAAGTTYTTTGSVGVNLLASAASSVSTNQFFTVF
jgi:hypothetical protein